MKRNKIVIFFEFITIIVILGILGIILIASLEIFEIIPIPEKYSVLKYIPTTVEVSIKEYEDGNLITNVVKNENKVVINKDYISNNSLLNKIEKVDVNVSKNDKNEIKSSKYYYSLLDEHGKIIYDKFLNSIEELKTGTYKLEFKNTFNDLLKQENGSEVLEKAFQKSLNAFIYDNPEIFYIDIRKMYLHTETKTILAKKTSNVYIAPKEGENYLNNSFNSKEDINMAIENLRQIVQDIKVEISDKSKYTQIKYVHDYLINNLEYDRSLSNENIYNIYGALINKLTVCEGYTKAFKYILDQLDIESIFVFGIGINDGKEESHSWNYVYLEENWYAVDVTWDDPIIIGGGSLGKKERYKNFLNGSVDFGKNHIITGKIVDGVEFIYPELSQNNYQ